MRLRGLAPAKVNLFLHVGAVGADGYHPLSSLVAFADIGDVLTVEPAERLSLAVTGPFAAGLSDGEDNLILRVLRALGETTGDGEPGLRVTLDKRLPVAAGLGGGSADAGAALRLARQALDLDLDLDAAALEALADIAGADGPMCVRSRPAWTSGRGERLVAEPGLPPLHAVLFNPGVPSSTGAVYRACDSGPLGGDDTPAPPEDWRPSSVIDWLSRQRNDLQDPAVRLEPRIGDAVALMAQAPGAGLARMSGSGATVFGLFADAASAAAAADGLAAGHPQAWTRACVLGGPTTLTV